MVDNFSLNASYCHERAEECARQADQEADLERKRELLDMQRRWLWLARSYERSEFVSTLARETTSKVEKVKP